MNNDDDLNEENNVENNEPSTPSNSSSGLRNFLKSPARAIGNKAKDTLKTAAKELWNRIPLMLKVKIGIVIAIVIIIIIAALVALSIIKEASRAFTDSIDNYIESVADTDVLDDKTKSLYKNKGSLIGFSLEQINDMYNIYLNDRTSNNKAKENLQKLFGINDVENERIVDVDDKIELYKHILLTEKYNFNKIKWKQYGHGIDGEDSNLKEDKNIGLKYPSDQNNTKVDTFIDFTLPYLQTWYIPLSMYSSSLTQGATEDSGMNSKFAYNILKKAYSEILVNRYDVQKYTLNTKYKEYNKITKHMVYEVGKFEIQTGTVYNPVTRLTEPVITTTYYIKSSKEVVDSTEYIDERKGSDGKGTLDPLNEEKVSNEIVVKNKYFIKEAKTFDMIQTNSFEYKKYKQDDVNSRKNAKTEVETNTEPYKETENIPTFTPTQEGTVLGANYIEKVGNIHYITRSWEDSLTQTSNESKLYTYDDVISYNENAEQDDDKDTIAKEEFEKDSDDVDYYSVLNDKQVINRIDFINSNPKIYKKYLQKGSEYSNYVGYSRSYLNYSYSELKDLIQNMKTKFGRIPFVYGRTLGIDESYFSSGSNGIGTSSGAGLGAMVNKAIELGESGGVWHYCQGGSNITASDDKGRGFFSTMEQLNGMISNGIMQGTDCSAFVWSMYKTFTGVDIAGGSGGANSGLIVSVANANNGGSLPGAENITVEINPITNLDDLQPGDVLYREGHVGLYVGKINGKYMQVDHGGPGGLSDGRLCSFSSGSDSSWVGPKYREITKTTYTNYIHYSGFATGSVVEGDITEEVSVADQQELLKTLDDYTTGSANTNWGTINNSWTLQYYKDNDVELIARIICHENSLWQASENNEGAAEMVKCMTLIMMNRIYGIQGHAAYGSAYAAILADNQFYSGSGRKDEFNIPPPQWIRQLVYEIYNGIQVPPEYWDKDLYYWAGPSDVSTSWTSGFFSNLSQVVAIKIDNSWIWHCFLKETSDTKNRSIVDPSRGYYSNQWHISSSAKLANGFTSVYIAQ